MAEKNSGFLLLLNILSTKYSKLQNNLELKKQVLKCIRCKDKGNHKKVFLTLTKLKLN